MNAVVFSRRFHALMLLCALSASADVAPLLAAESERLVVGVMIEGNEVDTLEAIKEDERFLLPLSALAQQIGATLAPDGAAMRVLTPAGDVTLYPEHLRQIDGNAYISQQTLEQKFYIRLTFDPQEFAITLELPWRSGGARQKRPKAPLAPDILPPAAGISEIRQEVTYADELDADAYPAYASVTTVKGHLQGASWNLQYHNDWEGTSRLSQYDAFWISKHAAAQIGLQSAQLYPLMHGIELTGLQAGWSNHNLEDIAISTTTQEIFGRRSHPVNAFRGEATPGFVAQLRVNGRIVAVQEIGLDGEYEFSEITLSSGTLNEVEIYLFDRRNLRVPVEIRRVSMTTSDLLAPDGKYTLLLGGGVDGNWVNDRLEPPDEPAPETFAGFAQGRYGATEWLTLEVGAQQSRDTAQLHGGIVARLGHHAVLSAGTVRSRDKFGYASQFEAVFSRWQLFAASSQTPAYFSDEHDDEAYWDDRLRISADPLQSLKLGVFARRIHSETQRREYVRPFGIWSPHRLFRLYAQPDDEGDYRLQADLTPHASTRVSVIFEDPRWTVDAEFSFLERYAFTLAAVMDEEQKHPRYSADFSYSGDWVNGVLLRAGIEIADERTNFSASAGKYLLPGIRAELEYRRTDPFFSATLAQTEERIWAKVSANIALTGWRMQPLYHTKSQKWRGAIAGRVRIAGRRSSVRDIVVIINDHKRVRTDASGFFYADNLAQGVYGVELDVESLPIELVPERVAFTVAVKANATTRVDFLARPEFGAAGRVTDAQGQPLAGVFVQAVNAAGAVAQSAATDQFGLFRIDGLPPGAYTLRIAPESLLPGASSAPQRKITIADDFLFQQDLAWPE